jgi:hypothetical protein
VPKAKEVYSVDPEHKHMYPFPIFASWAGQTGYQALIEMLPAEPELQQILDLFQKRAQSCSFPHTPEDLTKKEISRFLSDAETNAQKHPDMLALIFITLATGLQMGEWDRNGGEWIEGPASTRTAKQADIYRQSLLIALPSSC